ncbi:MAG: site-specific DNA-methyltransferase [Candidatus Sumerlaeia bacterium]|nr:site-specific DNA-methyltransferase [Candidatus Sumerlaeia bacterium]
MPPKASQLTAATASDAIVFEGDCLELLRTVADGQVQLVVTSPPYNLGKEYEKRSSIDQYVAWQSQVIRECLRVLKPEGSICWQVGNYVDNGSIIPLDIVLYPVFASLGMKMRNRIIWHFEHGLHCKRRLSGRYETVIWFTKSEDFYFDLDPIRVPQKYPGKRYFKGPRAGELSCNPKGKNPGDVWIIPNVKSNHVEKTAHPCQFPIELVERLILSMSRAGDVVLDPFAGTGSTMAAAVRNGRKGWGAEKEQKYATIARSRISLAKKGTLPVRERNTPVFDPKHAGAKLTTAPWIVVSDPGAVPSSDEDGQIAFCEEPMAYSEGAR